MKPNPVVQCPHCLAKAIGEGAPVDPHYQEREALKARVDTLSHNLRIAMAFLEHSCRCELEPQGRICTSCRGLALITE